MDNPPEIILERVESINSPQLHGSGGVNTNFMDDEAYNKLYIKPRSSFSAFRSG